MQVEEQRQSLRKRHFTAEEKRNYCRLWELSGLTKRAFCRREGLSPATLISWLTKLNRDIGPVGGSIFVPVKIVDNSSITIKSLTVALPNGISVSGHFTPEELPIWLKELGDAFTSLR